MNFYELDSTLALFSSLKMSRTKYGGHNFSRFLVNSFRRSAVCKFVELHGEHECDRGLTHKSKFDCSFNEFN